MHLRSLPLALALLLKFSITAGTEVSAGSVRVLTFIELFAKKLVTSVAGGIALRCWMQRLAPSTQGGIRPDIGGSLAQVGPSLQYGRGR